MLSPQASLLRYLAALVGPQSRLTVDPNIIAPSSAGSQPLTGADDESYTRDKKGKLKDQGSVEAMPNVYQQWEDIAPKNFFETGGGYGTSPVMYRHPALNGWFNQ